MTPKQCREARELLKWSRAELSDAARVPLWFIAAFEDERDAPEFLAEFETAIHDAFEAAGIGFPFVLSAGRATHLKVTYTQPDREELN